ncbi:hypothetical protein KAT72_15125 [Aeromonas popoffii]|uniref:Intracellular growth attenuator family protein n=1 Tax=Aeromonas popoffii TaxID=70856 RepID=A0ABS5GTF9_9GAMM|nr:hypothetical protein [Aeromonas popoffii]MBR7630313.1 hypothetical protein [Aeromonas popoffii]
MHFTEALTVITIIVLIAKQLSWIIDNSDKQDIRKKAINELKTPPKETSKKLQDNSEKQHAPSIITSAKKDSKILSNEDIKILRKAYGKRFHDHDVYVHSGVFNYRHLSPGFRTRWFDTCLDELRVESIYWPDYTKDEVNKDQDQTITNVKGIIYKDALYVFECNGFSFFPELKKFQHYQKHHTKRPSDITIPNLLTFFSVILSLLSFMFVSSGADHMLLVLALLVIPLLAWLYWDTYRKRKLYLLDGICTIDSSNHFYGGTKKIHDLTIYDPLDTITPGHGYVLFGEQSGIRFAPTLINGKEYYSPLNKKGLGCAIILSLFLLQLGSVISDAENLLKHISLLYPEPIKIDDDNLNSLASAPLQSFVVINSVRLVPKQSNQSLCVYSNDDVNNYLLRTTASNIFDSIQYPRDRFNWKVTQEIPTNISNMLQNLKEYTSQHCQIKITPNNYNRIKSFQYLISDEMLGEYIYHRPSTFNYMEKITSYAYGIKIPDGSPLTGLITTKNIDDNGKLEISIDNDFNLEDNGGLYRKQCLFVHHLLLCIYFLIFLIISGRVKEEEN